ncbi:MAG: hypothetical protein GWN71_24575, partial [Gammaproteobacteria bacterium]|nr:hypothetical protein [Gemmatimonadota bacterium]NIU76620.1 hypothetical protein [Gammaproteobacteria bacterium]NIX22398.1 hypothetical protein [Actinomycetota bacterium]
RIELIIDSARRGRVGQAVSGVHPVPFGPHTQLFTNPEVVDWATLDYDEEAAELAQRTGVLPEGRYEACT